jgi:hypothetical protein
MPKEIALRLKQEVVLILILFLLSFSVFAQSHSEHSAQLFKRYDSGVAYNRVTEDVLTLSLSISAMERSQVAVRVCSKQPLLFALATSSANAFHIAELLTGGYGYTAERVMFLRSEDCLSAKKQSQPVTEIWTISAGAPLPSHVESLKSNQARLVSLGRISANRGVRDYRSALRHLIQNLHANPNSVGVVFGYFLQCPSPMLQRRLREVGRMFKESRLPPHRYLVRPIEWNDEVSTYPPDSEPRYPSIFIIEGTGDSWRR